MMLFLMLIIKINDGNNEIMRFKTSKHMSVMRNPDSVAYERHFLLLDPDPQQNARPDTNTRPNSALDLRRGCATVDMQSSNIQE